MLHQPTIEKLHTMKLHGMADAFRAQLETTELHQLSFEERFALLVDRQWLWKENRALARRLQAAKLNQRAVIEDVNYQYPRGPGSPALAHPRQQPMGAPETQSRVARTHRHRQELAGLCPGPESLSGRLLRSAQENQRVIPRVGHGHADGSIGRMLLRLAQIDVLLLDDFAMAPLKDSERRDFLEVCDDRYQRRSMILTSQMPVAHWHEQIGDPTIADSILDRLLHNAYRMELNGESMRKTLGRKPEPEEGQ